jgi:prepilin-type N-terminal cleavage/methylation domain-containing protein
MRVTRDVRGDHGVTLVEILVAVVILTVIIVPLSNALIVFLRNSDTTNQLLSENNDAQLAAAYFAQDVQSMGVRNTSTLALQKSVELNMAFNAGDFRCGGSGTPDAAVRFGIQDQRSLSGAPTLVKVAYVVRTVGTERQLHRLTCVGGSTTPESDVVVAHNLESTGSPVSVTCSTQCDHATNPPRSVTMTLHLKHAERARGNPLVITLTGQRRQT